MLNERQRGKLRLCLILLAAAALCFAACTAAALIMMGGATKVPVSITPAGDLPATDAALKAFAERYRAYAETDDGEELSLDQVRQQLNAEGYTTFARKIRDIRERLTALAGQLEAGDPKNAGLTMDDLVMQDSRLQTTDNRRVLGLAVRTQEGEASPNPMTHTQVESRLQELERILNNARASLVRSDMRTAMINLDWDAMTQARIGLMLPPDWLSQRDGSLGFSAQSGVRDAQLAWDLSRESLEEQSREMADEYAAGTSRTDPAAWLEDQMARLGERPELEHASFWWTVAYAFAILLGLAALWFSLLFAERGAKLYAVLCASLFALLALPAAVARMWQHIEILRAYGRLDWQVLTGAAGYGLATLLIMAFYGYAWTARKAKFRWLALAVLIAGCLACAALAVRNVMPAVALMGRGDILFGGVSAAFLLMNAGRLLLWALAIAAVIIGVRRVSDEAPATEPSMFPDLDAYRVNLRKGRK